MSIGPINQASLARRLAIVLVAAALVHPPRLLLDVVPDVERVTRAIAARPGARRMIGAVNIGLGALAPSVTAKPAVRANQRS